MYSVFSFISETRLYIGRGGNAIEHDITFKNPELQQLIKFGHKQIRYYSIADPLPRDKHYTYSNFKKWK